MKGVSAIQHGLTDSSTQATATTDSPHKCRFRLDDSTSATFTLPDGRQLGYAQWGSPTGRAIFILHGLPGSRLEFTTWNDEASKQNARIIAVDRPGIGLSSPQPHRKLLDHASDIEQLAEHLELDAYVVLGGSAGGPYALACAAAITSDKLKGISVVVGIGAPDMSKRGMSWMNWLGLNLGRYSPAVVRWFFQRQPAARLDLDDETRLELVRQQFAPEKLHARDAGWAADTELREDLFRVHMWSSRQTFAHGFEGIMQDGVLIASDFGFRIEDIRPDLPVQLWYGRYDEVAPPGIGEQTAERLGARARLYMEDETHSSLIFHCKERILEACLANF